MTWASRICFSLIAAGYLQAAVVTGSITTLNRSKSSPPSSSKDQSGVVVWLDPSNPAAVRPAPRTAKMVQKAKTFVPHVLAVPVNSSVDFPNFDPIFHNAFSNFGGQVFDVGLYPPGTSRTVKFRRDGVVRIFCNIHPTMSAVIVVLKTPWFAVSSGDGSFRIGDVPPGSYTMRVFHERATEAVLSALERNVSITSDVTLPRIEISEAGYIAIPHKNKYGKEYPRVIEDAVPYSGVRR